MSPLLQWLCTGYAPEDLKRRHEALTIEITRKSLVSTNPFA